jgi:hypothetical protein
MRLVPKDAKGFEKFVYIFVEVFVVGWLFVFQLSAWQILKNDYQRAVAEASWMWHVVGGILSFIAIAVTILGAMDKLTFLGEKVASSINWIVFIALGLSIFAYTGFDWNFKVW